MGDPNYFALVGLTGGIASGKSTVAGILVDLGVGVIDADVLARQVVAPNTPGADEIRQAFGPAVFDDEGALDRAALGDLVFDDADARRRLEAITHPRIAGQMMQRARRLRQQGASWAVYDAALIVENNLDDRLDSLIVVAADPEVCLQRIVERDGLTREQARRRIAAQLPVADKVAVADYVVDNNGSLAETRRQTETIYHQIDSRVRATGTAKPDAPDDP